MLRPGASREGTPLIVGLGNPGREYAATRHNLGWLALDELCTHAAIPGGFKKKFQGEFAKGTIGAREVIFLRPETYMNESGRSVQGALAFFHAAPRDVIVLHDELDLPFGDVRVKVGGGHAGHNGIRSLIQNLGADFVRVRMGVGRPPPSFAGEVADFLLSAFLADERVKVPDIVTRGVTAVRKILSDGLERAMNEINTRPKRPSGNGSAGSGGSEDGKQAASVALGSPTARHGAVRLLAPGHTSSGPSSTRRLHITWQRQPRRTSAPENTRPFTF
ncbi:MAG TPA: aminoacyl-tRNA hydrolase [Polyangiaceae bacterium]|nr:aminoacyl-tRNA hydrolase [Polyangiaceae bacterium]